MRESEVERQCDAIAEAFGYRVVRLSQRRGSRIHIGLPDRRYQGPRGCVFVEVKPANGQLSEAQFAFLIAEIEGGCLATVGGTLEVREVLSALVRDKASALGICRKHIQFWASKGFRREAA